MQTLQRVSGSFIVCGAIGIVAQALMMLYMNVNPAMAVFLMLVTIDVLGIILAAFGLYAKLEKIGFLGASLPLSGLGAMIVSMYSGMRLSGMPAGPAFKTVTLTFLKVIGLGGLGAIAVGVVHYLIG